MSKGTSIWIIVAVLAIALIAGYFLWMSPSTPPQAVQNAAPQTGGGQSAQNAVPQPQAPQQPQVTAENSTNAALDQDAANVDTSMKAFDADTAQADTGMSDKPLPQEY